MLAGRKKLTYFICVICSSPYSKMLDHTLGQEIYILYPDQALYLKKQAGVRSGSQNAPSVNKAGDGTFGLSTASRFLLFHPSVRCSKKQSTYTKTAVASHKLLRSLSNLETCNSVISVRTELNGDVIRGTAVYSMGDEEDARPWQQLAVKTAKSFSFENYTEVVKIDDSRYTATVRKCDGNDALEEGEYAVSSTGNENERPESVIFTQPEYCPVLQNRKVSRTILEDFTDMEEVRELLDTYDRHVPADLDLDIMKSNMKHPFIVVEGLDATGKTTLTQILENRLKAARYYTPPPPVEHLRKHFDALPEIVRRAFYSLGNYIVSMEISKECQDKPVIMDRYWHSTAAYGIANETSKSDLPLKGHRIYHWPSDLLRPTLVLFLTVGEEIRKQRLHGRSTEKTFEEKHLDRDRLFRERLCTAYRRMEDPACVEIDASGSVDSVVDAAVKLLQENGVMV